MCWGDLDKAGEAADGGGGVGKGVGFEDGNGGGCGVGRVSSVGTGVLGCKSGKIGGKGVR